MVGENLQIRTKAFAIRVIKLARALEKDFIAKIIGTQILRSGTSVAANYRAACRCKSRKDFIAKLSIVIEEADETCFWLEILEESGLVGAEKISALYQEAQEITKIMASSKNSAIKNQGKK